MDFNDLSRRWQHQPAAPAPTSTALQALLSRQPNAPVARLRYNVWFEIGSTLVAGLLLLAALRLAHQPALNQLALLLAPFYAGTGYCYLRTLQVLRSLGHATGVLAEHVAGQLRQLRRLARLYHAAVMLATLVLLGLGTYVAISQVLPVVPAAAQCNFLVWLGLTVVASYGITDWLNRRHLRSFYGQHLDRLEAVLHELSPSPEALG